MIIRLIALFLFVSLLTGCQNDAEPAADPDPTPSASTTIKPAPAKAPTKPATATCHVLSYKAASAPTNRAKAVPCKARHTAETFFVGPLDTLVDGHLVAVDSARVQRQVATSCPKRFASFIGGTPEQRRLSMLSPVWFSPTVEQSDAGHTWYRCEVVATGAPGTLDELGGPMKGVLGTSAGRNMYGMCGTARPGTADFTRVACARKHSWRAVSTIDVPPGKGDAWPGEKAARAVGQDICADIVRDRAEDPLKFTWGYEWPTREQWSTGQRYGFCWAPAA